MDNTELITEEVQESLSDTGNALQKSPEILGRLPQAIEAEKALLGALLLSGSEFFEQVKLLLQERDFYAPRHRLIFKAMESLADENSRSFDPVNVCDILNSHNQLNKAGGQEYIHELLHGALIAGDIESYAKLIKNRSIIRELIAVSHQILRDCHTAYNREPDYLLAKAEQELQRVVDSRPKEGELLPVSMALKKAISKMEEIQSKGSSIIGLSTGFNDLDRKLSGWQESDLIILAARPSMGKTALALNFVYQAAMSQEKPVLVFSVEMPSNAVMMRILSFMTKLPLQKIREAKLTRPEMGRLEAAVEQLRNRPLYIDDSPDLTTYDMRSRIRRIMKSTGEENPALIMVDYLQLIRQPEQSENRNQEVSEMSRDLRQIAREFKCPVIVLSQLSRAVEKRNSQTPKPINSDLRDSGSIEQDADIILFIYRDEYYKADKSKSPGIAEIIISKHRNGETGVVKLAFLGKFASFGDLAREQEAGYQ